MTQLKPYTSEDGSSVVKESFTTQIGSGLATSDHFRGVTKLIGLGSNRRAEPEKHFLGTWNLPKYHFYRRGKASFICFARL
jgi:hypothetical protein